MSNQQPGSFLDSKMLLAIALTTVVWVGWQYHLQKKYPQSKSPVTTEQAAGNQVQTVKAGAEMPPAPAAAKVDELAPSDSKSEQVLKVDGKNWSFLISSRGMGLRDFELKKFTDRENRAVRIGHKVGESLPLATGLLGQAAGLDFNLEKVSDTQFVGRARIGGNVEIVKTISLNEDQYRIDAQVQLSGNDERVMGLTTHLTEALLASTGGGFMKPQFDRQDVYAVTAEKTERNYLDPTKDLQVKLNQGETVSVGTQYFTQALADHSDVRPELAINVSSAAKSVLASFNYPYLNRGQGMVIKYTAFFGPKDLELMKSVDESLVGAVDFGFFALLGRPILYLLKWFHGVVGNWGVAIILLTLLVRFLVLPFNVMSFRSMKGMQAIQPQLQVLKEKYKDDPTRLNQETLSLFKANKVNPLGGCLPVFLQIPIFFALYQVLGHSVELYHAPFALWIHDLSHQDPYYVLPVLMGISMFLQQKLTPTAVDPAQAKVMMFLPLIFSIFMLTLPSGLTLYIFVSTLFGIAQQMYLMKGQPLKKATTQK